MISYSTIPNLLLIKYIITKIHMVSKFKKTMIVKDSPFIIENNVNQKFYK